MFIMKKIASFFVFLLAFSAFAFADEAPVDDSNWGIQPEKAQGQYLNDVSTPEETWNDTHDTIIFDKYGSEDSPAFLNRENINPNESDYAYGHSDGR